MTIEETRQDLFYHAEVPLARFLFLDLDRQN